MVGAGGETDRQTETETWDGPEGLVGLNGRFPKNGGRQLKSSKQNKEMSKNGVKTKRSLQLQWEE